MTSTSKQQLQQPSRPQANSCIRVREAGVRTETERPTSFENRFLRFPSARSVPFPLSESRLTSLCRGQSGAPPARR